MPDYKALYFKLFSAMADAVEALENKRPECAKVILIRAQQAAEEAYISDGPRTVRLRSAEQS